MNREFKNSNFHTGTKVAIFYLLNHSTIRVSKHTIQIAAYVRVSTDDQYEDHYMRAIRQEHSEEGNQIDGFCDLGERSRDQDRLARTRSRDTESCGPALNASSTNCR